MEGENSCWKFAFNDFIFVVGSASNSVGRTLEFAAFRSRPDAKYSRASAFWFSLPTIMVFAAVRTHFFPGKKHQHVQVERHLVTEKEISSKINVSQMRQNLWPSGKMPAGAAGESSSILSIDTILFQFFF